MTSWGVPVGHAPHLPMAHATSVDPALTSLLQCYQHGLLDEIPLDEAAEILRVHGEVGQLEGADGHLQQMFATAAIAGDMGTGQGHDGGAGVGDASGQALLWGNEGRANSKVGQEQQIPQQPPPNCHGSGSERPDHSGTGEDLADPAASRTLTLHDVILALQRGPPRPRHLPLRGPGPAALVEGVREVPGVHLPELLEVAQRRAQVPVLAWMGREQRWSPSPSTEAEAVPEYLCQELLPISPPGHFPHYSQFSIPSRRSLASPGSAPVERTKSDRTMSIAKAGRSQRHRIGSSASIWE